jgi:hypothetical protein
LFPPSGVREVFSTVAFQAAGEIRERRSRRLFARLRRMRFRVRTRTYAASNREAQVQTAVTGMKGVRVVRGARNARGMNGASGASGVRGVKNM